MLALSFARCTITVILCCCTVKIAAVSIAGNTLVTVDIIRQSTAIPYTALPRNTMVVLTLIYIKNALIFWVRVGTIKVSHITLPGANFRAGFLRNKGGTHNGNQNDCFGKTSSLPFHRRIARRSYLPVVDNASSEIRPEGVTAVGSQYTTGRHSSCTTE